MAEAPLIVLTADRPPELQNVGANQTIDHTRIFGKYARSYVPLPCPDALISAQAVLAAIDQAVHDCFSSPAGVVHINCPFREPLATDPVSDEQFASMPGLERWRENDAPHTQHVITNTLPDPHAVARARKIIGSARQGLIIAGGASYTTLDRLVKKRLAGEWPWPVFADVTSNVRVSECPLMISNYDQLLLSPEYRAGCMPDVIIQIGGRCVSKRLYQLIESAKPEHFLRVSASAHQDDPTLSATMRVHCSPRTFFDTVFSDGFRAPSNNKWNQWHSGASKLAASAVAAGLAEPIAITEPGLALNVARELDSGALYLGSSMPIRDMDMFGGAFHDAVEVVANRGASGIDGNIATAAGYSSAWNERTTAIIGDLAALHDLNSLTLLRQEGVKLTLIIVNNDGGGIFHFLPIAHQLDVFERYFATPHGFQFEHAAKMFDLPYARPSTMNEFLKIFRDFAASGGSNIIEVNTNREENVAFHRAIGEAVVKALEGY